MKVFPQNDDTCFRPAMMGRQTSWGMILAGFFVFLSAVGCGTTKWSDTTRTGTEQLLISHAIDRAVSQLDFYKLYGKTVYIDSKAVASATDSQYLISAIHQHLLASGAKVMPKDDDVECIVELRSGALGTDRHDLFYGIPAFNMPAGLASANTTVGIAAIPEIAIVKRTDQRAVVKIAVFAYNKKSHNPVWQSGNIQTESRIRARWLFGAGPFSSGDICDGTSLAGSSLSPRVAQVIDFNLLENGEEMPPPSVTTPALYTEHSENEAPLPKTDLENQGTDTPPAPETVPAVPKPAPDIVPASATVPPDRAATTQATAPVTVPAPVADTAAAPVTPPANSPNPTIVIPVYTPPPNTQLDQPYRINTGVGMLQ